MIKWLVCFFLISTLTHAHEHFDFDQPEISDAIIKREEYIADLEKILQKLIGATVSITLNGDVLDSALIISPACATIKNYRPLNTAGLGFYSISCRWSTSRYSYQLQLK